MLSKQGNSIHTTRNLNVAVALATCGVPCTINRMVDDATGDQAACLFHLDPRPLLSPAGDDGSPPLDFSTGMVLKGLRDGTFEAADPAHPVCDCIAALEIYECIRTFMERDHRYQIARVLNGQGRARLIPGHEPASDSKRPAIKTESLILATALVRCGVPLLAVEGTRPNRRIVLARHGYDLGGNLSPISNLPSSTASPSPSPAVDALALAAAINDNSLAKTHSAHPALYAIMALHHRQQFLNEIKHGRHAILLRDPKSTAWNRRFSGAIIPSDAGGKAIDKAREEFRR